MSTDELKKIFAANLKRLRGDVPQGKIAVKLGISQQTYARWESGVVAPQAATLKKLSQLFKVSETALLTEFTASNARESEMPRSAKAVPLISWARAGEFIDYEDLCRQIEEWVDADTKDPNAFAVEIEGDSMEPRFCAGDRVVVSPNAEPRNGDYVVARLNDGGVVFKKYRRTGKDGGTVRLESINENYSPIERDAVAFAWIYPVISVVVQLRR